MHAIQQTRLTIHIYAFKKEYIFLIIGITLNLALQYRFIKVFVFIG